MESRAGLEGVVVTTSGITDVDGEAGRLYYRGYGIEDLAERASFEEVAFLLMEGELPSAAALAAFRDGLAGLRVTPAWLDSFMTGVPVAAHPLAVLRAAVAIDALVAGDVEPGDAEATRRAGLRMIALFPIVVAAWARRRRGLDPVAPAAGLDHAPNFLWMLHGVEPSAEGARALDVALVLHADHEFNASTFAARVAAGTEADLHSALVAALATLKGPKHGGANEDVVQMLDEVGAPERAADWVAKKIVWRETLAPEERQSIRARFPGFGHRVYKVEDPRARHLREMARRLAEEQGYAGDFETAEAVRAALEEARGLKVNVDFYSALVYRALGIDPDLCLAIFAIARVAGWVAHFEEQLGNNRLIRPRSEYVGPAPRPFPAVPASA
ncbi:MAG: citrate synthase [Dehalococcoidia bacterium]|nr:citrate synthase [Dehalococcoidia bacterium]